MNPNAEWLAADGLGGFASGTVSGIRTRRYHAMLLVAAQPPAGRCVMVNGFDAAVETPTGTFPISSQRYAPDVIHPDGRNRIAEFQYTPNPRWVYALEDGTRIAQELVAAHESPAVRVTWRLLTPRAGIRLSVRLFFSGRDYHCLHHENPAFRFEPEHKDDLLIWRPYDGLPQVCVQANAEYRHAPDWYRNFFYSEEANRGMDAVEDLAMPGIFTFNLSAADAGLTLSVDPAPVAQAFSPVSASPKDSYIVKHGARRTIIAGYPWFTDWGRDTFIAMRGLCPEHAQEILSGWADWVSEGMLPNRFPDGDAPPEYNSVDASLWFVIAAHEHPGPKITAAINAILDGYTAGTRYGIHMDTDGLLAAGVPGMQLTWMDAKVGDWVVTPRIGKPVEVQALWLNALKLAGREAAFKRGVSAFRRKFWDKSRGYLLDVADPDDASFRPNQIFAAGGLPVSLVTPDIAKRVVDAVEQRLLTPLGLRTLAPDDPAYAPHYRGGPRERDAAYHQGTVWPWLIGPFAEAWLRVYGDKAEARKRFLDPLTAHLEEYGLGHLPEIADGDAPHTPEGCPFQAWSLGEFLRITKLLGS